MKKLITALAFTALAAGAFAVTDENTNKKATAKPSAASAAAAAKAGQAKPAVPAASAPKK